MLERAIVDGFTSSLNYRMLCGYYVTIALQQIEALRRTNNYKARYYVAPDAQTVVIPAFGTYEYQVNMKKGSIFWAYNFANPTGLYSFNIFDPCTGRIASDGVLGSGTSPALWEGQIILPTPHFVAGGLLNVEIGSLSDADSTLNTLQVVLICMEPLVGCEDLCNAI